MRHEMRAPQARTSYQLTFAVLATAVTAFALLQSLVIPVLATIQTHLHTSQNSVTWVLTAYLLSASIFTPIVGRLGDMFGKERVLVIALAVLAAGCVLAALTNSLTVMVVARVIQGVGGGVVPLSFGLIRDEFPGEKVAGAIGVIAALAAAGAGLGIVLAGPIVDALDYHWLFWIPTVVIVIAAVAAQLVIPESRIRTPGRINWGAAMLLSGWLVALLLAVSEAPEWGWGSLKVIGLIVLAVVIGVLWILVETRSANPLVDMRMMRIPTVWTTNLVALLLGFGMYAAFAFLPQYLETPASAGYGFGAGITHAGLILLPASVAMFVVGGFSGRLSAKYGARAVLGAGCVLAVVAFGVLTVARAHQWQIVLAMAIEGVAFGLAFAAMSSLVVQAVPIEQTGVASGMNANIRTIGGGIGSAVVSSIVTGTVAANGLPTDAGYSRGFLAMTIVTIAAAAAATLIPRPRRAGVSATAPKVPEELPVTAAGGSPSSI
jgi:EmrB/QacA subfamily drug resistance transporter